MQVIVGNIAGYRLMTCWTCEQQVRQSTMQFTAQSVTCPLSYIYHSLHYAWPRRREENRTEFICMQWAVVNLKRNMCSMYCTVEATDRHEASHCLSAIDPSNSQDCRRSCWGLQTWIHWIFEKNWYNIIIPSQVGRFRWNLADRCWATFRLWRYSWNRNRK